ncbi:Integral membrane protein [Lysobacter dokdonensis DS-58]|uniref:Integral membrane protein n=1 Tax=Lysobacter dokdonensis DS-58 TaxID=1300345 RepID=A0A0A2X264_9GAMM|nr:membrane protein [Lysobacter dokdonensis]KGQ19324.1 Integral membrane protein [Lysobacter dokdonensis DS-58]
MNERTSSKVPAVTAGFWLVKILATTLGETAGDAVTMSMGLGYLAGTLIFAAIFAAAVYAQSRARDFHPIVYWTTIVASTTVGTTLADYADRSLGIGYTGGASVLACLVLASLFAWHRTLGTIAVDSVGDAKSEGFYWVTIMFSQTLGTALGDWVADTAGMGYLGGVVVFGGALAVVALLYFKSRVSHVALFWAAFILTRPLGAVVGDFLDKPVAHGGLDLSRYTASLVIAAAIAGCIALFPQRAAR